MRKRRKRRRTIKWAPVLWLLFIVDTCVGLALSPSTSADLVRVVGAKDSDRERIVRILQGLRDVPCLRANAYAFETSCLSLPETKSADLSRNIFRRASLTVSYREPVARIFGFPGVALSREGIVYRTTDPLKGLPLLKIPGTAPAPQLSLCSCWDGRSLAYVCTRVRSIEDMEKTVVQVDSRGALCLNSGIGSRIILGQAERLDEKLERLADILHRQPGILLRVSELNLVSPTRAVMVRRMQGVKP